MTENTETAVVGEPAEEFTEKARLRGLFDARNNAAKAVREAPLREYDAGYSQSGAHIVSEYVQSAVTAYVIEAEPLFQNTDVGRRYWDDYDLRPIAIPDPPDNLRGSREIAGPPARTINRERDQIELSGVGDYVALSTPIVVTWSGISRAGARRRRTTESTTVGVPRSVSENVFRATNKMLADLDIGLDAEQVTDSQASYDYSDLL